MSDRRQRQKELRAAKRDAERKQKARRELWRRIRIALIFGLVVVGTILVAGVLGGDQNALSGTYEGFRAQETACGAQPPAPATVMSFDAPEPQPDITATATVTATLNTSCGEIVIELDPASFPETVNSFVFLAREGFYDGHVFHRIVENFVIQGGDPVADGSGGPGYIISDEFPDDPDFVYEEGVVAMFNRGARSTGSQFFIVIGDDGRHLVPRFNVLGRVISGTDTLQRIAEVETGIVPVGREQSLPLQSVYIEAVEIEVTGS